jgi:hypothetical protein
MHSELTRYAEIVRLSGASWIEDRLLLGRHMQRGVYALDFIVPGILKQNARACPEGQPLPLTRDRSLNPAHSLA